MSRWVTCRFTRQMSCRVNCGVYYRVSYRMLAYVPCGAAFGGASVAVRTDRLDDACATVTRIAKN
ncbi:MAG TPA: hypothetical protein VMH22_03460 [bacterium]|nr:hypothetical protein [bacterium]